MSLKRSLEESGDVGETSGETAAKRLRTTSDDNDYSDNDNKDVNNTYTGVAKSRVKWSTNSLRFASRRGSYVQYSTLPSRKFCKRDPGDHPSGRGEGGDVMGET